MSFEMAKEVYPWKSEKSDFNLVEKKCAGTLAAYAKLYYFSNKC